MCNKPWCLDMTPEHARDRAALIAAQDADAPKLADRIDAEAMRVLVAEFDRLREVVASIAKEGQ